MAVFDIADEKHFKDHVETVSNIVTIDNIRVLGLSADDAEFYTNFPVERKKKLLRKVCSLTLITAHCSSIDVQVDIRLVPMLAVLYLISHLDRANIGNAKIEGLVKDLGLTGIQWNIVLSIFFVPYVLLGEYHQSI